LESDFSAVIGPVAGGIIVISIIIILLAILIIFRRKKKLLRTRNNSDIILLEDRRTPISESRDVTKPIHVDHFVVGVDSNAFPVKNEFEQLADADAKYNVLKLETSVGEKFAQMNRLEFVNQKKKNLL
jgi:hypothetical protein